MRISTGACRDGNACKIFNLCYHRLMNISSIFGKRILKVLQRQSITALAVLAIAIGAVVPLFNLSEATVAGATVNLAVGSFALTDAKGVVKTTFAPNEPIYIKTTLKNTAKASSPSGIKTEFYANQPSTVAKGTVDSPEFAIQHGYFPKSSNYSYASYPGGTRVDQFIGATRSFSQSTPGAYVARVFIDATDLAVETSSSDNQATVRYTISGNTTPAPTQNLPPTVPSSKIDLAVDSLQLTDVNGKVKTSFKTYEPIFIKVALRNKGSTKSSVGIRTEFYANMPSTATVGSKDTPEIGILHGYFPANSSAYTYESRPKGNKLNQFIGLARTFHQPNAGKYTARVFIDATNLDGEPNESNNQLTLTYTVTAAQWPQLVTNPLALDMIANKKHILSSTFEPNDLVHPNISNPKNHYLRQEAATALEQMAAAASSQGITLRLMSGYRSYWTQYNLYWNYVASSSQSKADTFSARPGHSEHQTGLTLDIGDGNATQCDIKSCFANTTGGQWVTAHAHEYGYIIRYPAGKEAITGYKAEPWHIRYVGKTLALALKDSGLTMEEYFNVPGGGY